ncbi:hypothetical protein GJ744_012501 [Endocarpon pusillum]|uniref:ATP synthase F0 n=1 Tax=Endocarpon pusillum TaxID=364733 RepID=A0A8H7AEB8_9EURO|nr:hypothetical protein GJ744_012501 [Endocarpon pusillum]
MAVQEYNPFAKREKHSQRSLTTYKVLTIASWLLLAITVFYYTFNAPGDCKHGHDCHTIWGQNSRMRTPFALNSIVTSIYWIIVIIMQAGYVWHLFSSNETLVNSAANVGSHFIISNLLFFAFILLWVRSHFWPAELFLILNFVNLTSLYFRHSTTPRFIHIPVVSAPLAFTYVGILWCGAAAVHAHSLVARIFANIAIWSILLYGGFFLLAFKDYTMGFELAILSLALALAQLGTHVMALQWIFAFVIMGCLVVLSVVIGVPGIFGDENAIRHPGHVVEPDRERQPLLDDH